MVSSKMRSLKNILLKIWYNIIFSIIFLYSICYNNDIGFHNIIKVTNICFFK